MNPQDKQSSSGQLAEVPAQQSTIATEATQQSQEDLRVLVQEIIDAELDCRDIRPSSGEQVQSSGATG